LDFGFAIESKIQNPKSKIAMSGLNAGKLRHRVAVQAARPSKQGPMGDVADAWPVIAGLESAPAEIKQLSGEKLLAARQVHPEATWTVQVRYDSRITARCRLVTDEGHTLYPIDCIADTLNRWQTLTCKERS
jgi:head-tail adaptor